MSPQAIKIGETSDAAMDLAALAENHEANLPNDFGKNLRMKIWAASVAGGGIRLGKPRRKIRGHSTYAS